MATLVAVQRASILVLSATLLTAGCTESATGPSAVAGITFGQPAPASGSTITVTGTGTPPGRFITRGSGQLSIPVTVRSGSGLPNARLFVYLLTDTGYCAQNLPDTPRWAPLEKGQTINLTITGFQVFQLPCDVRGVRAILDTRVGGVLSPAPPDGMAADVMLPVTYSIR
jgi:hypothetical protein